MPIFQFQAMDATGAELRDSIEADDCDDAQATIRQMGYFVTSIKEVNPYASPEGIGPKTFCIQIRYDALVAVLISILSFVAGWFTCAAMSLAGPR